MAIKLKMYKTLNYFRHRWQNGNKAVIILITSIPLFEQGLYLCTLPGRLRVVPHFSSGIVERAKREGA